MKYSVKEITSLVINVTDLEDTPENRVEILHRVAEIQAGLPMSPKRLYARMSIAAEINKLKLQSHIQKKYLY